jgi:hypothetical protein
MNNVVRIKTTHSVGVDGFTIFHNQMANAKIYFFLFLRKQCALKQNKNVFLEKKKTQQKSETETKLTTEKRKKKSWAKPNLSQVIITCGFSSPEIQKSIFIRV